MGYFSHDTAVIDSDVVIGDKTKVWHFCHIMSGARLGQNCILGQNVFIGGDVVIGNGVKIQNNVSVYNGVILEDEVFLGPSMVFTNVINPRSGVERKDEFGTTLVRKGATIGANATIICGVELGEYCFVGAGSVVTKSVAAFQLVVGNPAKPKGWYSAMGRKLLFDHSGYAVCPEDNTEYRLEDGKVFRLSSHH